MKLYESKKFLQIFSCCWVKLFLKYNLQLVNFQIRQHCIHCHIYTCYIYTCHIPVIFKGKNRDYTKKGFVKTSYCNAR